VADHVRRAVSVVVCALVLLVAPQVAQATFSGQAAPSLSVGTATMQAPTNVDAVEQCRYFLVFRTGVDVTVRGFTDAGPAGATYRYQLVRANDGAVLAQTTSTSRAATLSTGTASARYRLTIQATLGGWSSPVYTEDIAC